jgi:hypothetical protein
MGDVSSPHKYQWDPPKRRSPFVMAGMLIFKLFPDFQTLCIERVTGKSSELLFIRSLLIHRCPRDGSDIVRWSRCIQVR